MANPITLQPTAIPVQPLGAVPAPAPITLDPVNIPVGNAPGPAPNAPGPANLAATAVPGMAGQQVAQASQDLDQAGQDYSPYRGGTPDGSLRSTDAQATADSLNVLEHDKGLAGEEGKIRSKEASDLAAKQAEAATEKIQQARDFDSLQSQNLDRYNQAHAQTQAAYDEYRKAAGSLKDPNEQFWEDHGQGSRITAALAAFASGMGAGLTGHGGNPFMDFLSHQIDNNFQAHKQNIEDKYNSAVAAGKIEDTVENHNRFMNEAKLKSYDLASAHIQNELEAVKNGSASKLAKVTAAQAQQDLEAKGIAMRQQLAQKEAGRSAAALAAQRAQMKEVRDAYQKNLELHNKDMGEDEARIAAVKDLVGAGYDRSVIAPIASANGIGYDVSKGEWQIPKSEPTQDATEEPHYDDDGKLVVPTKTATGKRIDPKDIEEQKKDIESRTSNVDGKPAIFRTKEAAIAYAALPEAKRLFEEMKDAWANGDAGAYEGARNQFIEIAPKWMGFNRGPSLANTGEGKGAGAGEGANDTTDSEGTIGGQVPKMYLSPLGHLSKGVAAFVNKHPIGGNSLIGIANDKLVSLGKRLDEVDADARANLVTPQKLPEKPSSPADLAKKFGGGLTKVE